MVCGVTVHSSTSSFWTWKEFADRFFTTILVQTLLEFCFIPDQLTFKLTSLIYLNKYSRAFKCNILQEHNIDAQTLAAQFSWWNLMNVVMNKCFFAYHLPFHNIHKCTINDCLLFLRVCYSHIKNIESCGIAEQMLYIYLCTLYNVTFYNLK